MRVFHKLCSLVLCMVMLCTALPSLSHRVLAATVTYEVEGGNLYFDPETGTVTDCDSTVTKAEIPETIAGVPVTAIGDKAFRFCELLTYVALPNTLNMIGVGAFLYCKQLQSISIPEGVRELPVECFNDCWALKELTLPGSLEKVGWYAFYGCGVDDVYYYGTELKWSAVEVGTGNVELTTSNFHYLQEYEDNPFEDVKETEYFGRPVLWAVYNGITTGMSEDRFAPERGCTRGQIVTFLWRASGSPEPESLSNPFTDVSPEDYYYKAVLWAVKMKITQGVDSTHFNPNGTCTRGQAVTFLYRHRGTAIAPSTANPFADISSNDYFYDSVRWAAKHGITNGMESRKFAPELFCTRGQIVTFLFRYLYEKS
ncbi:MAG: S-layer homology domain-containing protein [Oscillospiraceae bacterium]|nr:S-layer homology domain-containing protein [Oscillospiraceae bacterium]